MSAEEQKKTSGFDQFREELADCWRKIPYKGLFLALVGLWILFFHFLGNSTLGYIDTKSLFGWMHYAYESNPDDQHGYLIPFAVLGLLWWKRKELMEVSARTWWPALIVVCLGLLVHLMGFMVQQSRLSIVGFFLGLYGLMGLAWGPQLLRTTFFPFFLFAFCVPLGNSAEYITFPLRMLVTVLSVGISTSVLGIDVIRDGSRIFDVAGTFQYDVAPACSGIRSLITLLALTTIYGFLTFRKTWKRLLMVFMAGPLAVAGNTVRITGVIVTGEAFGHDAGAWIEQKLGFVTFAVALVVILIMGHFLREDDPDPKPGEGRNKLDSESTVSPTAVS